MLTLIFMSKFRSCTLLLHIATECGYEAIVDSSTKNKGTSYMVLITISLANQPMGKLYEGSNTIIRALYKL